MADVRQVEIAGSGMGDEPPPVTDAAIAAFETSTGWRLPDEYIQLLKRRNGGYFPDELVLDVDVSGFAEDELYYFDEGRIGFNGFAGLAQGEASHLLTESLDLLEEWELPAGLLLIDGDGHTWIALDYRSRPTRPPVAFVVTDGPRIYPVADSFGEFFRRLRPAPDADGD